MELFGTKVLIEKLNLSKHTIRQYVCWEYFPVTNKSRRTFVSKETLENLLYLRSRGIPLSMYKETLEKPHKDGFDPETMSLKDYTNKGWTPSSGRESALNTKYKYRTYSSGMGDPSQTDMFEETTYVQPKYLQLHDTQQGDFDVKEYMFLKNKEDMDAEELKDAVNDILSELKEYEALLAKKDKGYTGRTIQVDKAGTRELINELQKTIAEQERDLYKLDKRIVELSKRMELLKAKNITR